MRGRVRLNIDVRFTRGHARAYGASYIQGQEIDPQVGVGLALGNLFGPLQAAIDGVSLDEVEGMILSAQRSCQGYWDAAIQEAQLNASGHPREINPESCSDLSGQSENTDSHFIEIGEEDL